MKASLQFPDTINEGEYNIHLKAWFSFTSTVKVIKASGLLFFCFLTRKNKSPTCADGKVPYHALSAL